jgi:hypothetical protein
VKFGFSIFVFLIFSVAAAGQVDSSRQENDTLPGRFYLLQKVKRDGEVLPEVQIKEVTILGHQRGSEARRMMSAYRKYERLVYNLKKAYPYAIITRMRLDEVNQDLMMITDEKERRKYLRGVEDAVFGEYEDDMRNLTITQGRLLIKLIDRETQNTSYELIKQYRGFLSAAFWQGIARIFGTNLKDEYDPYGEDILIELIIKDIETGRL